MSSRTHVEMPSRLGFAVPDSTLAEAEKDIRQEKLLRVLEPVVATVRRVLATATMIVPLAYFIQFCIDGGLLRSQAFDAVGLGGLLHAIVNPGIAAGNALFASKLVHSGWNFVFVFWFVVALIARYQILKPLRYAEVWMKDRRLRRAQEMEVSMGNLTGFPTANQLARMRAGGVTRIIKRRHSGVL